MTKKALIGWIGDIQTAIDGFTVDADFYINRLKPEDYEIDGPAIRGWQTRLARLREDLNTLYRRLDTYEDPR